MTKENFNFLDGIWIPALDRTLQSNTFCIIGGDPEIDRSKFLNQILEHNSISGKFGNRKAIVIFPNYEKKNLFEQSHFSGEIKKDMVHVLLPYGEYGTTNEVVKMVEENINKFQPEYVLIDGFELLFEKYDASGIVNPKPNFTLMKLRKLCDSLNIPMIITVPLFEVFENENIGRTPNSHSFGSKILEDLTDDLISMKIIEKSKEDNIQEKLTDRKIRITHINRKEPLLIYKIIYQSFETQFYYEK